MYIDKAGQKYWNDSWSASEVPECINPTDSSNSNKANRCFSKYFESLFLDRETQGKKLLEIGCAKSVWLPYFYNKFGFIVSGLDYSPIGCQIAKQVLINNNIKGEIVCEDFFAPPAAMIAAFDVVVSFGVVEHFEDTQACVRAVSAFLKPGGILITVIPNMVGLVGFVQKLINRPVFDIHQLIDSSQLRQAHKRAGLKLVECDYFMGANFGVCNLAGIPSNTITGFLKKIMLALLWRISILSWLVEDKFGAIPPNRLTSPYIKCISYKY